MGAPIFVSPAKSLAEKRQKKSLTSQGFVYLKLGIMVSVA